MELKITQNEYAHRFQRTRISLGQVLVNDLGFDVRSNFNFKILK